MDAPGTIRRPDLHPRLRWGALVLARHGGPWLEERVRTLLRLVDRVLVLEGIGALLPCDHLEGYDVTRFQGASEQVGGRLRSAFDPEPFGAGERLLQRVAEGPWEEAANRALEELGTHDVLVLGEHEFLLDPLEVLHAFERTPRASSASLEVVQVFDGGRRQRTVPARVLVAARPGTGFRFLGPRAGEPSGLDRLDAQVFDHTHLDEQLDPSVGRTSLRVDPHPPAVQRLLGVGSKRPPGGVPDATILVPFYGQVEMTRRCVEAILRHALPEGPSFEILLRDDGGPEPLGELDELLRDPRVRLSRAAQNQGFLRTCNAAAREARGRYLVLLNNDTEPCAGWLDALVACADGDPSVGCVAATLLYPDGSLQEVGGILWRDASGWNYGRGDHETWQPRYWYRREVDYGSGACLLVRRELWEATGGFDERFAPAYYEDADLCLEARERGLRVLVEPRARVVHLEGKSCGTDLASGVKQHQVTNRERFREKWAERLDRHHHPAPRSAEEVHALREHGVRGHVLAAGSGFPYFDRDAGGLRLLEILKLLRARGLCVSFLAQSWCGDVAHRRRLEQEGVRCLTGARHLDRELSTRDSLQPKLLGLLAEQPLDLAYLYSYPTARRIGKYLYRHSPATRQVVDMVDLHFLRLRRQAEVSGDPRVAEEAERVRVRELETYRESDLVVAISDSEAARVRELLPRVPVVVLPLIYSCVEGPLTREGRRDLLFVGSFSHPPNGDALHYLAQEVLPRLWRTHPDVAVDVVGSGHDDSLQALASERLRFLGRVDDLGPLFRSHVALAAPLRFGAGAKGKIAQSLSQGLPVVTTAVGVEGMGLEPDEHLLVAEEPEAFAEHLRRLLDDAPRWRELAEAGRQRIAADDSVGLARQQLDAILDDPTRRPFWTTWLRRLRANMR